MLISFMIIIMILVCAPSAKANDWGIALPWGEPEIPAPNIKPYELPTLHGEAPHYNAPIPALHPAPKIDPDTIFESVLRCYPEKSKFKVDLNLVAGMRASIDEYNRDVWPDISDHYIGIVGKMPLYSTTEQSRERQWEYQRRTATATAVASFTQALADRNYAYRMMGLYLSLEARSQQRVAQGVANISEQVTLLEKVAATHRDVLAHEAKLVEHRLALVAMCEETQSPIVNRYLEQLVNLPNLRPHSGTSHEVAQP